MRRVEAGGKLGSRQIITCVHTYAGGAGAESAPQQMGPTPNFPRPLRNHALQTICVLNKWQIHPRPLRACVNIPTVMEQECQNPAVSAPQPLRAYMNVALEGIHDIYTQISLNILSWAPNGLKYEIV